MFSQYNYCSFEKKETRHSVFVLLKHVIYAKYLANIFFMPCGTIKTRDHFMLIFET